MICGSSHSGLKSQNIQTLVTASSGLETRDPPSLAKQHTPCYVPKDKFINCEILDPQLRGASTAYSGALRKASTQSQMLANLISPHVKPILV